jgi:hypothetical protein
VDPRSLRRGVPLYEGGGGTERGGGSCEECGQHDAANDSRAVKPLLTGKTGEWAEMGNARFHNSKGWGLLLDAGRKKRILKCFK